ncbi:WD40/YVTN/BNR-like repeat-containing protein [Pseudomonas alkylphenolica]|uniref:WD40/YVTN/BNR-like repeat-containing protein n=1 Tax=Pseudomonas alkylphenolica TaxID=237609 RepID=UPI0018D63930|nr:YCF48-related protein [Pseudomonas alkylphenolica]MBH3430311.1 BNR domain-containing protein [Pseudomonas alkylphenolica]
MKKIVCGLLMAASCALLPVWAAETVDVLSQKAVAGTQALGAVLLDVTPAGARLVAVGERGVVLLSDDNGQHWRQAVSPVSTTLTCVQFVDASNGWAVGHSGVVLHSNDGGERWQLQLDGKQAAALELQAAERTDDSRRFAAAQRLLADGADKPLLAMSFADARHGLVLGAYGLALITEDGGTTWQSLMGSLPNPRGLHLYAVARQGDEIVIAGEQGLLLRSINGGRTFDALKGPYEGSYFATTLLPNGRMLVGGLRGKLFTSDDGGQSFQPVNTPVPASLNALHIAGKQLLAVNQAGMLMRSELSTLDLQPMGVSDGLPLTAVTEAADGALVTVGMGEPRRLAPFSPNTIAD